MKVITLFLCFLYAPYIYTQTIEVSYENFSTPDPRLNDLKGVPSEALPLYLTHLKNSYSVKRLRATATLSDYVDLGDFKRDTTLKHGKATRVAKNYFIDFTEKAIYQSSLQIPGVFTKEQLTEKITWTLTEETKVILNYTCQKAIGNKNGEEVEAWYCPNLPSSAGPSTYFGLPGLILEVKDKDKMYVATQVKILKKGEVELKAPTDLKNVSKAEFSELSNETLQKLSGKSW